MITLARLTAVRLIPLICLAFTALGNAAAIAKATFVIGDVHARNAQGIARALVRDNELEAGETVITGPRSVAQLIFVDQTRVAIRPTSEVGIDQFNYSADTAGETDSMVLRLARGALRSVTGLIGIRNHQHFSLNTPVATIGIRGTDFEAVHIPEEGGFGEGKIPPGTYNKVYTGGTAMTTKAGVIELKLNETGFVGLSVKAGVLLPTKIDQLPAAIINVINSVPVPGTETSNSREVPATKTEQVDERGTQQNAEHQDGPPRGSEEHAAPSDAPAPSPKGDASYTKLPISAAPPSFNNAAAAPDGTTLKGVKSALNPVRLAPEALDKAHIDTTAMPDAPRTVLPSASPSTLQAAPLIELKQQNLTPLPSAGLPTLQATPTLELKTETLKTLPTTVLPTLQAVPTIELKTQTLTNLPTAPIQELKTQILTTLPTAPLTTLQAVPSTELKTLTTLPAVVAPLPQVAPKTNTLQLSPNLLLHR